MRLRISVESMVLIAVCTADMLLTLFLVLKGMAVEVNPLMAACINHGPGVFVLVKMASFVPFVVAVEFYRRKNSEFARAACRCAIALYLIAFTVLTVGVNAT